MPYLFRQLFPGFHLMQCPDNIALIQKSPISVAHRPHTTSDQQGYRPLFRRFFRLLAYWKMKND